METPSAATYGHETPLPMAPARQGLATYGIERDPETVMSRHPARLHTALRLRQQMPRHGLPVSSHPFALAAPLSHGKLYDFGPGKRMFRILAAYFRKVTGIFVNYHSNGLAALIL